MIAEFADLVTDEALTKLIGDIKLIEETHLKNMPPQHRSLAHLALHTIKFESENRGLDRESLNVGFCIAEILLQRIGIVKAILDYGSSMVAAGRAMEKRAQEDSYARALLENIDLAKKWGAEQGLDAKAIESLEKSIRSGADPHEHEHEREQPKSV